ncbi:MAG: hypothetical protein ACOC3V_03470 [bacterium]
MFLWILISILAVSISFNVYLSIKCLKNKSCNNSRDKEMRTMLNTFESEIRSMRNKYKLYKK